MGVPLAHSNESMERFFAHISSSPIPQTVSIDYLTRNGFTLHNDPELRLILRRLGFVGAGRKTTPTKVWRAYKEQGAPVLREQVLICYRELFKLYPDAATSRTNKELEGWFGTPPATRGAESSIKRAIRTFRCLCRLAGLGQEVALLKSTTSNAASQSPDTTSAPLDAQMSSLPLSLNLPAGRTRAEYVEIFAAFKEVFYSN